MVWWLFSAKAKAKRRLRDVLRHATSDGSLDDAEYAAIAGALTDAGLTEAETYTVRHDALCALAAGHTGRENKAIEPTKAEWLGKVAAWLRVPMPTAVEAAMRRGRWINGDLAPSDPPAGMLLKRGETPYVVVPASLYEERVVRTRFKGGSRGVSVRIAKGVSYRVGASRGTAVSEREAVAVSGGELVMTNQRIVFLGDRKGFEIPYAKLTHLQAFADGAQFSDAQGRVRQVRWLGLPDADDVAAAMTGALRHAQD